MEENDLISSAELARHIAGQDYQLRDYLKFGIVVAVAKVARLERVGFNNAQEENWMVPTEVWEGDGNNSHFSIFSDRYVTRALGTGYRGVELIGLQFRRRDIEAAFGIQLTQSHDANSLPPVKARRGGPGVPPDAERWGKMMAAMAVLADNGELDTGSENKFHASIANYLAAKGHEPLGIDVMRPVIRRYLAWSRGECFPDDQTPAG